MCPRAPGLLGVSSAARAVNYRPRTLLVWHWADDPLAPRPPRPSVTCGIHDALVADGDTMVSAPIDGPFGRTFTFADPDGYQLTLHDRA